MTYDIYMHYKKLYLTKYHISTANPIQMAAILNYQMAVTLKLFILQCMQHYMSGHCNVYNTTCLDTKIKSISCYLAEKLIAI